MRASSNHSPTFGHDPVAHERAHGVADVALLVGEQLVDGEEVVGADRLAGVAAAAVMGSSLT